MNQLKKTFTIIEHSFDVVVLGSLEEVVYVVLMNVPKWFKNGSSN